MLGEPLTKHQPVSFPVISLVSRGSAMLAQELQSDINTEGWIKWEI